MRKLPETALSTQSRKNPRHATGKVDINEKSTKVAAIPRSCADQIAAARNLSLFARLLTASRSCLFGLIRFGHGLVARDSLVIGNSHSLLDFSSNVRSNEES